MRDVDRARRRPAPARAGSARYARRSFLAMDRTPESMFFDNFASIRLADQQRAARAGLRAAATRAARVRRVARLLQRAERREHAARSAALRRHQDLSRRAADEAGPDEHGGVDREPRAVSRSQAGRVRRDAARRVEAVGLDDQARAARGDEGRCCRESILNRPKMGFPVPFAGWTRGALERRRARRAARSPLARARPHRSAGRRTRCCAITPPAAPTAATASGAC